MLEYGVCVFLLVLHVLQSNYRSVVNTLRHHVGGADYLCMHNYRMIPTT